MNLLRVGAIAATIAAAGTVAFTPRAEALTLHIAEACGGHASRGMCLESDRYYGSTGAWDPAHENNETLNEWTYPGGGTLIATHITAFTLYPTRCTMTFYTKTHAAGSSYSVRGNASTAIHRTLPAAFINNTYSFRWTCPAS